MKYLIVFFFGVLVASAAAQTVNPYILSITPSYKVIDGPIIAAENLPITASPPIAAYLPAGIDPIKMTHIIQVDKDGYVICSTERKP